MSIDEDEEIELIGEEKNPCTTLVSQILNYVKSSVAENASKAKESAIDSLKKQKLPSEPNETGIKTFSQVIHFKLLAKRIKFAALQRNPKYKAATSLLQETIARPDRTTGMPLSSVIKLIADIYMNILFEVRPNEEAKAKYPLYFYAYNYLLSLYPVSKLADSKFKSLLETVLAMKAEYDSAAAHDQLSTKVLLFSKFLVIDDK